MNLYTDKEQKAIDKAMKIMEEKAKVYNGRAAFNSNEIAKRFFRLRLSGKKAEVFSVAFLTSQHDLIECVDMFHGSIASAQVYPRQIAQKALELNAASVIISHNHPSGSNEFSDDDIAITKKISKALGLLEIRVLDHILIGSIPKSYAQEGYSFS